MTRITYYSDFRDSNPSFYSFSSMDKSKTAYIYSENHYSGESLLFSNDDFDVNTFIDRDFSIFNPTASKHNVSSGILPPAVKAIGKNYVVYERPPRYQNVFFIPGTVDEINEGEEEGESFIPDVYSIPLPWQLYVATFDDNFYCSEVYMYFMQGALTSSDQSLHLVTLPNFFANGLLCRPMLDNMEDIDRYSKDIKGVIESSYDWVWNNGTNNDLTESLLHLYIQNPQGMIVNNIPSQEKYRYFDSQNLSGAYYINNVQSSLLLSAWEKTPIEDVINYKFPNPSLVRYFDRNSPNTINYDDVSRDFLYEYIVYLVEEEDGNTPDHDTVSEIIDLGDYDFHSYVLWCIDNEYYHPAPPAPSWAQEQDYSSILNMIINENFRLSTKKYTLLSDTVRYSPQSV